MGILTLKRSDLNVSDILVKIIAGPTASGKSSSALRYAENKAGVIINADSMQIYDALHTLTAQPSAQDLKSAPHLLYSYFKPEEKCSAPIWRELAIKEIYNAAEKNLMPIIVGGTGFYLKTLIEGLSPIPAISETTRLKAINLQKELGNPGFYNTLLEKDPVTAGKLNPNDTQRLIRAWEVLEETKKSLSYWQSLPPDPPPNDLRFEIETIIPDRDVLYKRCNDRFDQMIELGILDEVRDLNDKIKTNEVPPGALITNALGFTPIQNHLSGNLSIEDAIDRSKQETRNYAKRQLTWLRNQFSKYISK
jgi:tRNA dimethylallyltransferase